MTRVPLRRPRATRASVLPAVALVISAACSSAQPSPPPPTIAPPPPTPAPAVSPAAAASPSPLAAPSPLALGVRPAASPSPAVVSLGVVGGHSGSDLRTTIDLLLQEHLYLTAAAIDAAANGRQDEVGAASTTLDQSSSTLSQVVGAVKGADAQNQLVDAWRRRIGSLVDYARATAAQDATARAAARADVDSRGTAIAGLMAVGGLSQDTVQTQLGRETEALIGAADSLAAHDASAALSSVRGAATRVDDLGQPLASALQAQAPTQAPGPTEGADIDLRTRLDLLLEERSYLGGWAVDAAASRRDSDADAARAADDANAGELGQQLSDTFGGDVAARFSDLWKRQAADLVSYTRAAATNNGDARQQAQNDLDSMRSDMDGLLASANQLLPPGAVAEASKAPFQALLGAADSFVARDYVNGYTRIRDAARGAQRLGDQVAQTTVDRFPTRYMASGTPGPASATGGGAAAGGAPAAGATSGGPAAGAVGAAGGAAGAAGGGATGGAGGGTAGGGAAGGAAGTGGAPAGTGGAAGGAGAAGGTTGGSSGAATAGGGGAAGGATTGGATTGTGAGGAPSGPTGALTQPTPSGPSGSASTGGPTTGQPAAPIPTAQIPVISVPTVAPAAPAGGTGGAGAGTGAASTGTGAGSLSTGSGTGGTGTGTGTGGTGTGATGAGGVGTGGTGAGGTSPGTGAGVTGAGGTGAGGRSP